MCGILFSIHSAQADSDGAFHGLLQQLQAANAARGPDVQDTVLSSVGKHTLTFFASELRLRGEARVTQPHRDSSGNILCWNGEVFEGLMVHPEENDGAKLFEALRVLNASDEIRNCLATIEGPYALVYYHHASRRLYFARDPLGRRSLLIHRPTPAQPHFLLTSVSIGPHLMYAPDELSTENVYTLDVDKLASAHDMALAFEEAIKVLPRCNANSQAIHRFATPDQVNPSLPVDPPTVEGLDIIPPHLTSAVDDLLVCLNESVRLRVRDIPRVTSAPGQARVAVLFSGGIDSTMLAFLANRHVDPSEPIDLLNVAFENPRKIIVKAEGNIGGLPRREKKLKLREGVDYSAIDVSYNVPDRVTGLQEVEELRRLCPNRIWNLVEINVPYEESQGARSTVEAIMFPRRTVMDLSLALPLYFAARGRGQVKRSPDTPAEPYTTPARVLLNGLGSDELLGGYGRFRTAYQNGGWQAIVDELQLELDRIPTRNLGRDDRVISSHGKETRHPFLSLSVVNFLARLPVHLKMDPRREAGLGEKMLLRLAARKVGLVEASCRKKRAMQFGSHSARMIPGEGDRKGDLQLPE